MVDKARTSTDAVSDYDSSAGSTISSVWESSKPDISDDDILDGETYCSGTCSPVDPLEPCEENSEVMENGSEVNQYNLRPRSQIKRSVRYDYSPPAKRPRYSDEIETNKTSWNKQRKNDEGIGPAGGKGSSGRGGRQLRSRGGRQAAHRKNKGAKGSGGQSVSGQKGKGTTTKDDLPLSAISVKVKEKADIALDEFCPLREPGMYLPDMDVSVLSIFELFFDEMALKCILDCTLEYAELKKDKKS